jgi:hypothetical protein
MDNQIQQRQFTGVCKDDIGQPFAVDSPFLAQNRRSESGYYLPFDSVFLKEFVCDFVGIDDLAAQFGKLGRHGALARGDATQDSNDWFFPGLAHEQSV